MNDVQKQDVMIFAEALDLSLSERAAYLDRACAGDQKLRHRVEGLLLTHDQAGGFLERPPVEAAIGNMLGAFSGEKPGDRIGRYKLVQQIGEGGYGVVFVAEQEEPIHRRVALKVVKPGMDTKSVMARFEAERQALALMDHPNISHVFDAGATESGRPYFVMELVDGVKITDYCDRHSLPINARLNLFAQVCDAVQHAHQKGIIHRDIKPSNVLVTAGRDGKPAPKVIDFGIAKATDGQQLTDKTIFTAHEMLIGTPAYMSPEQAALASAEMDTRTDIYSLGVLLYELLTGTTPFDTRELLKAGLDEVRRVIRDEEPVRPSMRLTTMTDADLVSVSKHHGAEPPKLIREMRGELDWIVMKALEKDRSRRYQTADSFAEDIQHYLENKMVSARPPSRVYQFQKLVSRHKLGFAAFGIVMATLVAGLSSTIWSLAKEKKARSEADVQRRKALTGLARSQQVLKFMDDMLQNIGPEAAKGYDVTVLKAIFDHATERFDRELTNQPDVHAQLRYTVGRAYGLLGLLDKEERLLCAALEYYKKTPGTEQMLAATLCDMARMHMLKFRPPKLTEAEQEAREALALAKLAGDDYLQVVQMKTVLGLVLEQRGRWAEAETILREALDAGRRLGADKSYELIDTRSALARGLMVANKPGEAEPLLLESLAAAKEKHGEDHLVTAACLSMVASFRAAQAKLEQAESLYRKCLGVARKLVPRDHPFLDDSLRDLGKVLHREKKWNEAADIYRELLEIRRKRFRDDDSRVTETATELAKALLGSHDEVQFEKLAKNFPKIWIMRSDDLARRGQWSESLAAAAGFLTVQPNEYRGYYHAAPLLVQIGDRAAYEELCAKINAHFAGTTNPLTADRMAKACLILPRPGADLKVASELASVAVAGGQKDAAAKCTVALAEYRQGHWDGATNWAMKAAENPSASSRAEAYAILAMAQHHCQQTEAARVSLKKCTEIVQIQLPKPENGDLGGDWRGWIYAHALQSEAKRRIEGEPSSAARPASLPP